jgi:16S rRNA processing protein RimM
MTEQSYISVGTISKPHGIHGALLFKSDFFLSDLEKIPPFLFVQNKGTYDPLFIVMYDEKESGMVYLQFEHSKSRNDISAYAGKELFISNTEFANFYEENEENELANFIGFEAFEEDKNIGVIMDVIERGDQPLFLIENEEKEILIPAVDEFVLDYDEDLKKIFFSLPLGILDL